MKNSIKATTCHTSHLCSHRDSEQHVAQATAHKHTLVLTYYNILKDVGVVIGACRHLEPLSVSVCEVVEAEMGWGKNIL